jgi:RNA polymerase sigma-70 factor (ECF subfamily)
VRGEVERLVRRARSPRAPLAAQHAAFARLVALHEQMVFATALASLRDPEAARDAAQEAFLAAWRKLPQLRTPAAFPGWLQRLVRTQCARIRRKQTPPLEPPLRNDDDDALARAERRRAVMRALDALAPSDREALLLFHVLGEPQRKIAELFGVPEAAIGKRLYAARLRVRRLLPRTVAAEFLVTAPSRDFLRRVEAGMFDELTGTYRFESQPDRVVVIRRAGDLLISQAGGQRNVLASRGDDDLVTTRFDGEGRFKRDRRGRITHFVYYEFGRRLGVARKVTG